MEYLSKRQVIITPMAILFLSSSISFWHISVIKWLSFIFFIMLVLTDFLKYKLIINNNTIFYAVNIFGLTIYSKEIFASTIKKVLFKRTGWKSKLSLIKLHKGISLRISFFKPENLYDDLIKFCEENDILYEKTKDYKIIEKMC